MPAKSGMTIPPIIPPPKKDEACCTDVRRPPPLLGAGDAGNDAVALGLVSVLPVRGGIGGAPVPRGNDDLGDDTRGTGNRLISGA